MYRGRRHGQIGQEGPARVVRVVLYEMFITDKCSVIAPIAAESGGLQWYSDQRHSTTTIRLHDWQLHMANHPFCSHLRRLCSNQFLHELQLHHL